MKTVFDVMASKFEEDIIRLKNHVGMGKCENFADYKHVCGQIRGLTSALKQTNDLAKQQMEADDE